jgi:hypothetical protein
MTNATQGWIAHANSIMKEDISNKHQKLIDCINKMIKIHMRETKSLFISIEATTLTKP